MRIVLLPSCCLLLVSPSALHCPPALQWHNVHWAARRLRCLSIERSQATAKRRIESAGVRLTLVLVTCPPGASLFSSSWRVNCDADGNHVDFWSYKYHNTVTNIVDEKRTVPPMQEPSTYWTNVRTNPCFYSSSCFSMPAIRTKFQGIITL